jgi:hypothetical protein
MALKKFFKSGNVWTVGGFDAVPVGLFMRRIDEVSGIIFINVWDGMEKNRAPIAQGKFGEFCDEQGVAYATLAAFKAATDEFFIGQSVQILDNITEGTPVNAVAATGTLTVHTTDAPADGDTVLIGTKTYTFKTTLTPAEGEVLINTTNDAALLNLIRAINHSGTANTDYKCAAVHPLVSAAASVTSHAFAITAKVKGLAGIDIVTTSPIGTKLTWGHAHLLGGVDGTIGGLGKQYFDGTYQYLAVAANTIADANWVRAAIGSTY